ncbi:hypothetical protein MGG_05163 [Pyricularia oryzae 70-15]|uniref:Hsp70-like protein n=1 Tax=Pyricularia oryzae (strain 70-15 / ATCC MYA-4617 / FGSC 8958) TaxID=242507 RepID=G4N4S6_PYRO7|nr:uncharacterized protein MGG_05163 [Pyricularia oryzae 70-15]EHA52891.1 hypothetical protein MGG_05163 [Pyricularia oryzae 70-15]KAI7927670.1 hypothetical protein M0657_003072 [Pyricularia oryzae]KAI7930577.1 hypothetical protein M9X92_000641 [Pyricularia oryzae]
MSRREAYKQVRLILGLDFGTTFSDPAICFATSNTTDLGEIYTFTAWPGSCEQAGEHHVKTPSRIAYARENTGNSENDALTSDVTGYEVEAGYRSYSWFKLLLDGTALSSEYDDPELKLGRSEGLMCLPADKSAKDVTTDYLRGLYQTCQERLNRTFGNGRLASQLRYPVDVWLTVPATWSDKAKLLTQRAAKDAGFASHPGDRMFIIAEPEAAALAALKATISKVDDLVQVGDHVLICDCGGGTVDITTYNVLSTKPTLELEELLVGIGAKCGSTTIDRNIYKLMVERFGDAFTSLDGRCTGLGSYFMSTLENFKKGFSLARAKKRPSRIPLKMRNVPAEAIASNHYDADLDAVLLSADDMKNLFDPVIDNICGLLGDQITKAQEDVKEDVEGKRMKVILVGGFASSPYLCERLEAFLEDRNATLATPMKDAWSAIARGAVIRGLEGEIVKQRKCRRHYGVSFSHPYECSHHNGFNTSLRRTYMSLFTGKEYLTGFLTWKVDKGSVVTEQTEIQHRFTSSWTGDDHNSYRLDLYSCGADSPPETIECTDAEKVGSITYDLEDLDTSQLQCKIEPDGTRRYQAHLTMVIRMGDAAGLLTFKVFCQGSEVGSAHLDISSD